MITEGDEELQIFGRNAELPVRLQLGRRAWVKEKGKKPWRTDDITQTMAPISGMALAAEYTKVQKRNHQRKRLVVRLV
jgi:hypothetical protein